MFYKLLKKFYLFFFPVYKYLKYPSCRIERGLIHPTVKLGQSIVIKKSCKIGKDVEIGSYTYINEFTRIDPNTRRIGKYCSISHNVKIGMGPHPIDYLSTSPVFYSKSRGYVKEELYDEFLDKGYTTIGNDVLIGANAIIVAGVLVGDGAVIGAGSVVTKNVPPYAIVGGVPAKILRYRFENDTINKIVKSQWWNNSPKEIIENNIDVSNKEFFLEGIDNLKP